MHATVNINIKDYVSAIISWILLGRSATEPYSTSEIGLRSLSVF